MKATTAVAIAFSRSVISTDHADIEFRRYTKIMYNAQKRDPNDSFHFILHFSLFLLLCILCFVFLFFCFFSDLILLSLFYFDSIGFAHRVQARFFDSSISRSLCMCVCVCYARFDACFLHNAFKQHYVQSKTNEITRAIK